MSFVMQEITSQPETWARAADLAVTAETAAALPAPGERVAVVGCGTSLYMAKSFATLRETAGLGETDAFAASEYPRNRSYDRVIALTRSGTTTEVVDLLRALPEGHRSSVITTGTRFPAADAADDVIVMDFADESSIVQTRFATSALALWRAHLGQSLDTAIADARTALSEGVPAGVAAQEQFTFLGTGWTVGLADEAALKLREMAQTWTESYPAMEFRHGPISVIGERSAVWIFGAAPSGLVEELAVTGGTVVRSDLDPMAHLISAQLLGVQVAEGRGLNPDEPRNLTRSIILPG
ncbi:sugar isomerase [Nakamurella silvestris]|nr:sugar isomerase [Nakamurella silvestris]